MDKLNELKDYFDAQVCSFPGKVQYLYRDLGEPVRSLSDKEKEQVISASMIKIAIMLCLFEKIQEKNISFEQTMLPVGKEQILPDSQVFEYGECECSLYELTVWMMENSDNTATNVLMEYLGFSEMNSFFGRIGLKQTKAERFMLDYDAIAKGKNNYISPEDFYICMRILYEKKKNDQLYEKGWGIMLHNRDHEDLMRYLYEEPLCAHKSGELEGIEHDAGIFVTPFGTYFLGIFVSGYRKGSKMETEAMRLIGRLSRRVYDFYKEG